VSELAELEKLELVKSSARLLADAHEWLAAYQERNQMACTIGDAHPIVEAYIELRTKLAAAEARLASWEPVMKLSVEIMREWDAGIRAIGFDYKNSERAFAKAERWQEAVRALKPEDMP
jgi:hypothetical protein